MGSTPEPLPQTRLGRYLLFGEIASGGMASIHLARRLGDAGFRTTVAVKRLHPQYARDETFVAMFLTEARLAARIRHENVVTVLDVVAEGSEVFLVMDLVQGMSLSQLRAELNTHNTGPVPLPIAASILSGMLNGLHAAHEARAESGEPLQIVHRDVSPQNVLVGFDGVTRVVDFGIAHARNRFYETSGEGLIRGKLPYMSPEQIRGASFDRRTDLFSAGVVAWELLTGRRLFDHAEPPVVITKIASAPIEPPSAVRPELPRAVDAVVLRALSRDPAERYATAEAFAVALERVMGVAPARDVRDWLVEELGDSVTLRAEALARVESEAELTEITKSAALPDATAASSSAAHAKTPPTRRSPRATAAGRGVLLVALVSLAVVAFAGARGVGRPAAESTGSTSTFEGLADSASAAPPPAVRIANDTPSATSAVPPSVVKSSGRAPVRGAHRGSAPAATTSTSCNPPWIITAEGARRFKPECVR